MGYPPCAHMLVILVQSGDESQSVIARLRIEKMIEQSQVGQDLKRRLEPVLETHPMFAGITIQFDFDPLSHY